MIVLIIVDSMTPSAEAQITRDLMLMKGHDKDLHVSTPFHGVTLNQGLLEKIGVDVSLATPDMQVVYKTTDEWPEYDTRMETVLRDLKPTAEEHSLDPNYEVRYVLKPQGRDGTNRTEMYLNRAYPKGQGITNPWIPIVWGP